MREAVVVSTARTPIGKAFRGAFNDTQGQELARHAIRHAVQRAELEGGEVEDVVLGAALQQGSTGSNVARQALLRAGLPNTVSGYMPMLHTAEIVAERYGVSRERQDALALQSQQRTAAAQAAGRFDDEIVPLTSIAKVLDKVTGEISEREVTLTRDEGDRPSTTLKSLAGLKSVLLDGQVTAHSTITAGNASRLSTARRRRC